MIITGRSSNLRFPGGLPVDCYPDTKICYHRTKEISSQGLWQYHHTSQGKALHSCAKGSTRSLSHDLKANSSQLNSTYNHLPLFQRAYLNDTKVCGIYFQTFNRNLCIPPWASVRQPLNNIRDTDWDDYVSFWIIPFSFINMGESLKS